MLKINKILKGFTKVRNQLNMFIKQCEEERVALGKEQTALQTRLVRVTRERDEAKEVVRVIGTMCGGPGDGTV
jgi:hypothetical protein